MIFYRSFFDTPKKLSYFLFIQKFYRITHGSYSYEMGCFNCDSLQLLEY